MTKYLDDLRNDFISQGQIYQRFYDNRCLGHFLWRLIKIKSCMINDQSHGNTALMISWFDNEKKIDQDQTSPSSNSLWFVVSLLLRTDISTILSK